MVVGVVGLLVVASLTVTVGTGAAASRSPAGCPGVSGPSASAAGAGGSLIDPADGAGAVYGGEAVAASARGNSVEVLAPRPGAVIVVPSAARAHRLRLVATLFVGRRVRGLGLRLNGDRIRLPARSGRLRVVLDAADGLVVGENLLWVTVGARDKNPTVRFVVGYRGARALRVHLRLGAGTLPAAAASLRMPQTGVDRLSVTLNGAPLGVPPRGLPSGRLVLDLPQLGVAHWGANRVRVRLIMMDGRVADWARTFTLTRRRDVAVARLDGEPVVGRAVVLDARRSLIVHGIAQARGMRWVLLRRPVLSHARLGKPKGARIALRPDVPGYYVVGLRVGCGSRSGYDLATVAATYPDALVPLDTIHYAQAPPPPPGVWGVEVAGNFYASNYDAVQVVVLDRSTLGLIANTGYQGNAQSFDVMQGYLASLPSSDLVIVTHSGTESQGPLPSDSLPALDSALHAIGGNLGAKWQLFSPCWSGGTQYCSQSTRWDASLYGGSFSVVGVPGMTPGQAWRETAAQAGTQDGSLNGYLTLGTVATGGADQYTLVNGPEPYVPADTCTPANCAVTVGGQTYPSTPGVSGVHVVVLNGTTLQLITNQTVTTTAQLDSAISAMPAGGVPPVAHFILYGNGPFTDQRLVILQSVGNGSLSGSPGYDLIEKLDELGGTPDFLLASITGAHRYALIGAATDLPWHGASSVESSTAMTDRPAGTPGQPTGQIFGVVQRDRAGVYTPTAGDAVGPTNVALYSILYQPPVAWPIAGDPGLKYIADNIGMSGHPDVRSGYPDTNINFGTKAALLQGLACTSGPDVCGPDYAALKTELLKEFDWVMSVRGLADNLKAPYESTGPGSDYFDVQKVTDEIDNTLTPQDNSDVVMQFLNIFSWVMTKASNIAKDSGEGEAALAFGLAGAAATIATKVMSKPDGGPADSVKTTAAQLSQELFNQQTAYIQWVNHQFVDTVVSDYGKLSGVGGPAGGDDPSWDITGTTANHLIDALRAGTRAAAYSALMPAAWGGFNLKPGANQSSSNDVTSFICDEPYNYPNHHYPFASALPQNQFHAVTNYTQQAIDEVWTLATMHSWSTGQAAYAKLPTDSLTDNIYGPGSTGSDGAFEYGPSWWRTTYNPPSHATCGKGASNMDVNQVWSQNYPPPQITAPLP